MKYEICLKIIWKINTIYLYNDLFDIRGKLKITN